MPESRFLTLADVAEILSITPRHAYTMVRSGELVGIQIGGSGQWRVERTKLEDYIAQAYERTAEAVANQALAADADTVH